MKICRFTILVLMLALLLCPCVSAREKAKGKPYDPHVFQHMAQCTVLLLAENEQRKQARRAYKLPPTMAGYDNLEEMVQYANMYGIAYEAEKNNASIEESKARFVAAGKKADEDIAKAIKVIIDSPITDKYGVTSSMMEQRAANCATFYDIIATKAVSAGGSKKTK